MKGLVTFATCGASAAGTAVLIALTTPVPLSICGGPAHHPDQFPLHLELPRNVHPDRRQAEISPACRGGRGRALEAGHDCRRRADHARQPVGYHSLRGSRICLLDVRDTPKGGPRMHGGPPIPLPLSTEAYDRGDRFAASAPEPRARNLRRNAHAASGWRSLAISADRSEGRASAPTEGAILQGRATARRRAASIAGHRSDRDSASP
jgi:hypothetical protein